MKTMFKTLGLFLLLFLSNYLLFAEGEDEAARKTISGYIRDAETGEELIGATIYIKEIKTGTTSNVYGFYSISLLPGQYNFSVAYLGYENIEKQINLTENVTLNIEMQAKRTTIQEVVITGKIANENITKNETGVVKMNVETIRKIPAMMGEVDVIKAIQLLPGVSSAAEGSSGFSVRGGAADQNLILLDEAVVYNASHLMGFFSVFNNDVIKDVKLYKGDLPAMYGGRLSSMLDIRQKEGNLKHFSASGGIGLISSRLSVEAPIIKDKLSFVLAGRRSYADLFLPLSANEDVHDNKLYFYDFNGKINYIMNENNRFFLSRYEGRDVFGTGKDFKMSFGNSTITARWNHLFSKKLFSNFTYIRAHYDYQMDIDDEFSAFAIKWTSDMREHTLKADFGYYLNPYNTIRFGASSTYHKFEPGTVEPIDSEEDDEENFINKVEIPSINALNHNIYISNEQKIGALLTLSYGLRFSMFQNIGDATVYQFDKSDPQNYVATDTLKYDDWEVFKTYTRFEPRIRATYKLDEVSSIKASYSRNNQYVQLVSNSTVGSPLDVWLPSSPNLKPQQSDQYVIGYFRNFKNNMLEASAEFYYKKMDNQIDYKDHASIFLNTQLEGEIRVGEATSYGMELMLQKQTGKLTGWVSYAYSFAERDIPEINNGDAFTAPYNKPHQVNIVASYELNKRFNLGATWVYSTGVAATFPEGAYEYMNMYIPYFSERNGFRYPDYHRLDLSVDMKLGDIVRERKWNHSLNLSVYNAYYRKNPYMIQFTVDEDSYKPKAEMTYLFPIIPTLTYNFKFR